jgi:hypothetical protein
MGSTFWLAVEQLNWRLPTHDTEQDSPMAMRRFCFDPIKLQDSIRASFRPGNGHPQTEMQRTRHPAYQRQAGADRLAVRIIVRPAKFLVHACENGVHLLSRASAWQQEDRSMFCKGYAFALASALVLASMAGAIAAPGGAAAGGAAAGGAAGGASNGPGGGAGNGIANSGTGAMGAAGNSVGSTPEGGLPSSNSPSSPPPSSSSSSTGTSTEK